MLKIFFTVFLLTCTLQAQNNEITERINSFLQKLPSTTKSSVLIMNPMGEDTLFCLNHTQPMIPASNTKLFTTAVALSVMGGDYELSTKIMTGDLNLSDGIINGNLYIKGFGNSLLTTEDINKMAGELKNMGIKNITGDIIGDDTYFDDVYSRDDWIYEEAANIHLPPVSALVIDRNRKPVILTRRKRTRTYFVNIDNPPLHAAQLLKDELTSWGINISGKADKGTVPESAITIAESSVLLRDLLKAINKNSDNYLAECLFKTIGAVSSGVQGNSFYSTQTILNYIEDHGIYQKGTEVVDGSGISRYDQITTGAIVGLLEQVYFDLRIYDDFYESLSIGGVDGTLRHRFNGGPADSNFRGKTGTLNGVSSLSGYLATQSGEDLIISIMFEFSRGGADLHRDVQDIIVEYLSSL